MHGQTSLELRKHRPNPCHETYRHSLSVIVEVKNTQKLINFSSAHHFYRYWVWSPCLCRHI